MTGSVRGFTTTLLGYYFAREVQERGSEKPESTLALFLKFEQLAGYCRYAVAKDEEFRGIRYVQRNLADGKTVRLSAKPEDQILGNQKVYGLWGLFSGPARASGMVQREETVLTATAAAFVEEQYLAKLTAEVPKRLNVAEELQGFEEELAPMTDVLETAFPIRAELLPTDGSPLAVEPSVAAQHMARFQRIKELPFGLHLQWEPNAPDGALIGTARLRSRRQQPFTLLLRSLGGRLMLRCVSPIGSLEDGYDVASVAALTLPRPVQVAAIYDERFETYNLAVERETLLGAEEHDLDRIDDLIEDVVEAADLLENRLLQRDEPLATFREDLERESDDAD